MKLKLITILLGSLLLFSGFGLMADEAEEVYGWQLMTEQERAEHRERMRTMTNAEERHKYLEEHHKRMQERARERGVTLPEMPMHRERMKDREHMGPGHGMGDGMGGGRR